MARSNALYELLGKYQVLKNQNPEKCVECELEAMYEFVQKCNAVEGSSLTVDQVKDVISGGVNNVTDNNKEELEAAGLYDALLYVKKLVEDGTPLSEDVVKELHKITFVGSSVDFKGVYRTDFVTIPHARNMPPVRHISYFMNKLFEEYKEMAYLDILKKVALFHIKFENIHPFSDGNGQVGRLIVAYQLLKAGYPFMCIDPKDKKPYVKAIEKYNEELDDSAMVDIFTQALKDELKKRIKYLSK